MVMSTRRCASLGVTFIPFAASAAYAYERSSMIAARAETAPILRIDLSSSEHLLRFIVESYLLACLNSGDVHAECDGMAVSGFDGCIGSFSRANAFHPVAHIGGGLRICAGIRRGGGLFCVFHEREAGKQVGIHSHLCGRSSG